MQTSHGVANLRLPLVNETVRMTEIVKKVLKKDTVDPVTVTENAPRPETETAVKTVFVPIPVPVAIPMPIPMNTFPLITPIPFPVAMPVPIIVPTVRNSANGIMKEIQRIKSTIPSDPYEAEMILMAEMVEKNSNKTDNNSKIEADSDDNSDSGQSNPNTSKESILDSLNIEQLPIDLESSLITSNIILSNHAATQNVLLSNISDGQSHFLANEPTVAFLNRSSCSLQPQPPVALLTPNTNNGHSVSSVIVPNVLQRQHNEISTRSECKLNVALGLSAFNQWMELRKKCPYEHRLLNRLEKSNLLEMLPNELSQAIYLFANEVRKPDNNEYSSDTVYYLCLAIQKFLYDNHRTENLFFDRFFQKFQEVIDNKAIFFTNIRNDGGYIITRIEEEHLWESRQLGPHSPLALINTLLYLNSKFFNLNSLEKHSWLSFSRMIKHWKHESCTSRGGVGVGVSSSSSSILNTNSARINSNHHPLNNQYGAKMSNVTNRRVMLRFYPTQAVLDQHPELKQFYELQENLSDPIRCPVRLFDFYLSKCPEGVKNRNDVFYLQPEFSCVPDSPIWFTTKAIDEQSFQKMFRRIHFVKEINVAFLNE